METITKFTQQQYGNAKWRSHPGALRRLRCTAADHFAQLLPAADAPETPVFACKFAPHPAHARLLALANEDGYLAFHDAGAGLRFGTRAHTNAIFDIAWAPTEPTIATASGDHTVSLFALTNAEVVKVRSFWGHSRSVKTVAFRPGDSSVLATGGRDGKIIVWDTRAATGSSLGKPDRTIPNSHNTKPTPRSRRRCHCAAPSPSAAQTAKSVTGLVFQSADTLISCGAGDGPIKVWDLRKTYQTSKRAPAAKAHIPYAGQSTKNGYSNLIADVHALRLYANCLDNTIYAFNLMTYAPEPVCRYAGHLNSTFFIRSCLSPCGEYLMSGSSDEEAFIWSTKTQRALVRLRGHVAEVTCVAWSADNFTLVTCSDDLTHKIWRVGGELRPDGWEADGRGEAEVWRGEAVGKTPKTDGECKKCPSLPSSKRQREVEVENVAVGRQNGGYCAKRLFGEWQSNSLEGGLDNLPNFVMDGVAPHLNYSPPKLKHKDDWLTKWRRERLFRRGFEGGGREGGGEEEGERKEVKKNVVGTQQSPILRYFKVKCDGHSANGKHLHNTLNCTSNFKQT